MFALLDGAGRVGWSVLSEAVRALSSGTVLESDSDRPQPNHGNSNAVRRDASTPVVCAKLGKGRDVVPSGLGGSEDDLPAIRVRATRWGMKARHPLPARPADRCRFVCVGRRTGSLGPIDSYVSMSEPVRRPHWCQRSYGGFSGSLVRLDRDLELTARADSVGLIHLHIARTSVTRLLGTARATTALSETPGVRCWEVL